MVTRNRTKSANNNCQFYEQPSYQNTWIFRILQNKLSEYILYIHYKNYKICMFFFSFTNILNELEGFISFAYGFLITNIVLSIYCLCTRANYDVLNFWSSRILGFTWYLRTWYLRISLWFIISSLLTLE